MIEKHGVILFYDNAVECFNFPIKNSIRISIWNRGDSSTTTSEITPDKINWPINIGELRNVKILFDSSFNCRKYCLIGVYPKSIGEIIIQ